MANLKEIRTRIASVKSTRQITSAMKLVSAAKLRKAQNKITQLRPYADKLDFILASIGQNLMEDDSFGLIQKREVEKVLVVIITSNRGLCGAFNTNAVKKAISHIQENYADKSVSLMCVGKKGGEIAKKYPYEIIRQENDIFDDLNFTNSAKLSESLAEIYLSGEFDKIDLVYNSFKNAATQELKADSYLPIQVNEEEQEIETDYIFEPSKLEIGQELIPKSLNIHFYKSLLDSNAAEHGARMTSMHQATDNATDLLYDLTLEYNKARQAAITNEILEIVSGAEALNA